MKDQMMIQRSIVNVDIRIKHHCYRCNDKEYAYLMIFLSWISIQDRKWNKIRGTTWPTFYLDQVKTVKQLLYFYKIGKW